MSDPQTLPSEPGWHPFTCPGCGEAVDVSADAIGKLAICPYCNTQFSPEEQDDEAASELAREHELARREAELSALRIRAVAAERRGILRTRSYWILVLVALCITPIKLVTMSLPLLRGKFSFTAIGYLLAAAACASAIPWPIKRIRALNNELRKPMLQEPPEPPDFSTLSDGSQRWKNLEQL